MSWWKGCTIISFSLNYSQKFIYIFFVCVQQNSLKRPIIICLFMIHNYSVSHILIFTWRMAFYKPMLCGEVYVISWHFIMWLLIEKCKFVRAFVSVATQPSGADIWMIFDGFQCFYLKAWRRKSDTFWLTVKIKQILRANR